jgi:hypothetical protein
MTEYQKIAIGLLGLTHPEIHLPRPTAWRIEQKPTQARQPGPGGTHSSAAVRALKFAFAALVAGSRAVPLGDNGQLTRELGAYGEHLSR